MGPGDAEGGDRVEVAYLLRGEAVAGAIPAGHVEAEGQHGDGGGARVWDVEVARAYAVRDDLPDDLADLSLPRGDVGQVGWAERAGLVKDDVGDLAVVGGPEGQDVDQACEPVCR